MKGKDISSLVIYAGNFIGGVKGLGHFGTHPYITGAFAFKKLVGAVSKKCRSEFVPRLIEAAGTAYFGILAGYDLVDVLKGNFSSVPNLLANGSMAVQLTLETKSAYDESGADLLDDLGIYRIGVSKRKLVESVVQNAPNPVENIPHTPRRKAYRLIRFPGEILEKIVSLLDFFKHVGVTYLPGQHPEGDPTLSGPEFQKMLRQQEQPLSPHVIGKRKR